MANTWQGAFPRENLATDGYERTSPVTAFPPNGYGLYDMIGNVWEWTTDWYAPKHEADALKACCIPENPRGGREADSYDECDKLVRIPLSANSAQGRQGRLASLRAELLPPLPTGCAPCATDRLGHDSCRLPMHYQNLA
jgi:formylglycine-generating enzyme required for sulfatase activity